MPYLLDANSLKKIKRAVHKADTAPKCSDYRGDVAPNFYCKTTEEIEADDTGTATILKREGSSWEETNWTIPIINQTGATIGQYADVLADWESQSGTYIVWSGATSESQLEVKAQTFYSNAAESSAQSMTTTASAITIDLDTSTGDSLLSLSSNEMTATAAGTYWVALTPAWDLKDGEQSAVVWNYLEKWGGSSWSTVPWSFNASDIVRIDTITHVDTTTGIPDTWSGSGYLGWKSGHSFPVFASAGDKFRIRALVLAFFLGRVGYTFTKVYTVNGNTGSSVRAYSISWYLPSLA